ncbi:transposase domain-containing protein [Enhydrobacter sp.]|uniref:transposase domain-containing protein n=1 Tax=Enhydrobacter sp. TaxID=1894999 RepID=UPI00261D3636|nr:transposase domain-containing protein [Enhydrobacter sp.]
MITTAKFNDREPYAYLKEVLQRLTNGHRASRARRPPPLDLDALHMTRVQGVDAYVSDRTGTQSKRPIRRRQGARPPPFTRFP